MLQDTCRLTGETCDFGENGDGRAIQVEGRKALDGTTNIFAFSSQHAYGLWVAEQILGLPRIGAKTEVFGDLMHFLETVFDSDETPDDEDIYERATYWCEAEAYLLLDYVKAYHLLDREVTTSGERLHDVVFNVVVDFLTEVASLCSEVIFGPPVRYDGHGKPYLVSEVVA
tara:strand:+ start:311 stop:823 length:513 start_codon:yes stop_codon:yes gene_type:complete